MVIRNFTSVPIVFVVMATTVICDGARPLLAANAQVNSSATPSSPAHVLLYVNDGYIYTNTSDLGDPRRVTRGEGPVRGPGNSIVYSHDDQIWKFDLGSGLRNVFDIPQNHTDLAASPVGLLYSSGGMIWQCNPDGSGKNSLTRGSDPEWVNDSSFLYTHGRQLLLFDTNRASASTILKRQKAATHKDGRLAFALETGVLVDDPDGQIRFNSHQLGKVVGSSKLIVSPMDRGGHQELFVLDHIVGGKGERFIEEIAWAPDGSKIGFTTYHVERPIGSWGKPIFMYNVRLCDLKKGRCTVLERDLPFVSGLEWVSATRLAVSQFNDVSYWSRSKDGERVKVILADQSLTPEIFSQIGLDKSLLDRDRIHVYDVTSRGKTTFSGHGLSVRT